MCKYIFCCCCCSNGVEKLVEESDTSTVVTEQPHLSEPIPNLQPNLNSEPSSPVLEQPTKQNSEPPQLNNQNSVKPNPIQRIPKVPPVISNLNSEPSSPVLEQPTKQKSEPPQLNNQNTVKPNPIQRIPKVPPVISNLNSEPSSPVLEPPTKQNSEPPQLNNQNTVKPNPIQRIPKVTRVISNLNSEPSSPVLEPPTKQKSEPPQLNNKTTVKPNPIQRIPKVPSVISNLKAEPSWQTYQLLQKEHNLSVNTAQQLVQLFAEGNTLPFIARHRKDIIGAMTTEELRNIKATYDKLLQLRRDLVRIHSVIVSMEMMSKELHTTLMNVKSRKALDEMYAPYETVAEKKASAERQKLAVCEEYANMILQGASPIINSVDKTTIIQLVAVKICSSQPSLEYLQSLCKQAHCSLSCNRLNYQKFNHKYHGYYNRTFITKDLKAHQILAINRAENLKLINVTLGFADFSFGYYNHIRKHFPKALSANVFVESMKFCYKNKAVPLLKRMKRAALTDFAQKSALDVYTSNVKQLLLTTPVKNKRILGVDPGTSLGCKLGLISETGEVLATGVVFPNAHNHEQQKQKFRNMLKQHHCSLIAIGNGTGCREAEAWISAMISSNYFAPLQVSYTIVNENGASIYSCSPEAIREFKNMDPILIGAISLARRVQNPLSELVKVEPRHMGVGMYQHDLDPDRLKHALDEVISECVSFVGVDVNTASQCLLRHVAGLSDSLADEIILHRNRHGDFTQRKDIYKVRGINTLTYKQCVGFLKVLNGANKLDETSVHPESYEVVRRIMKTLKMRQDQVGTGTFRVKVIEHRGVFMIGYKKLGTSRERLECILDGLTEKEEVRETPFCERMFRNDVRNVNQLYVGIELTGAVTNVTTFGSFIDVGVGIKGLVHVNNAKGVNLQIGNRVKVMVCNLNKNRQRIGLKLIKVL